MLQGGALLILCLLQRHQQIVLHSEAAEHRIAKRHAVFCIDIAEGGLRALGGHGDALEHHIHVDLHKADHKLLAREGDGLDRNGDNHLFILTLQILDGDFRLRNGVIVKGILIDVRLGSQGRIDEAFVIHKRKALQVEQQLHSGLIGLQVLRVAQILLRHHPDGDVDHVDIVGKVVLHHLLSAACQLIQV